MKQDSRIVNLLHNLLIGICGLYAFGASLSFIYFQYQFIKVDEFIDLITGVDPFVAFIKCLIWPYYIF